MRSSLYKTWERFPMIWLGLVVSILLTIILTKIMMLLTAYEGSTYFLTRTLRNGSTEFRAVNNSPASGSMIVLTMIYMVMLIPLFFIIRDSIFTITKGRAFNKVLDLANGGSKKDVAEVAQLLNVISGSDYGIKVYSVIFKYADPHRLGRFLASLIHTTCAPYTGECIEKITADLWSECRWETSAISTPARQMRKLIIGARAQHKNLGDTIDARFTTLLEERRKREVQEMEETRKAKILSAAKRALPI